MICRYAFISLLCCCALGQTPAPGPSFEVADIKLSNSNSTDESYFTIQPGGLFVAHNARVNELFQFAFKIRRQAIYGAPSWFDADRIDITAKATPTASIQDLQLMLQSLLVSEFKIRMHTEQRPTSAFVLVVGKSGPRLKNSTATTRADCKRVADEATPPGGTHLVCTNMKISELAEGLPDLAGGYIDRPVIDQTGLTASYDFALEWVRRSVADQTGGPTIFIAVEKLGLEFVQRKVSLPAIVIERMERLA